MTATCTFLTSFVPGYPLERLNLFMGHIFFYPITHGFVGVTRKEFLEGLRDLIPSFCGFEVFGRRAITHLDTLNPESQRRRRRNCLQRIHNNLLRQSPMLHP